MSQGKLADGQKPHTSGQFYIFISLISFGFVCVVCFLPLLDFACLIEIRFRAIHEVRAGQHLARSRAPMCIFLDFLISLIFLFFIFRFLDSRVFACPTGNKMLLIYTLDLIHARNQQGRKETNDNNR